MAQTLEAKGIVPRPCAPMPAAERLPRLIKQWELVKFAGEGSLARIYRARPAGAPSAQGAAYAVKMLRPQWQDDPQAVRLLQREALVGRGVSSRHLAPVLATSLIRSPQYIVFPWLEGASLDARIRAGQQFDIPQILWIARQTAEALDALHMAGWMHGDVSPGNIHVSPSGHVTLIDLSFARRHDEIGSAADRPIMGTCVYLAPEYLTSALRPDAKSDIYSLGAVMFELLTGRPPYRAKSLEELADQQRHAAPPELARLAPHVPREAVRLVRRMLAREPLRRPQSPRELVAQLVALEVATFTHRPW
jgi:serine/threonine protein kinase